MKTKVGFARMSVRFSVAELGVTHVYQCVSGILERSQSNFVYATALLAESFSVVWRSLW